MQPHDVLSIISNIREIADGVAPGAPDFVVEKVGLRNPMDNSCRWPGPETPARPWLQRKSWKGARTYDIVPPRMNLYSENNMGICDR
jgi:hypothetical protein